MGSRASSQSIRINIREAGYNSRLLGGELGSVPRIVLCSRGFRKSYGDWHLRPFAQAFRDAKPIDPCQAPWRN